MSDPTEYLPPPPPSGRPAEEPPSPEMRARRNRLVALLMMVPFSFPAWFAARSRDAELARRTQWAVAVNIAQSVLLVCVVGTAVALAANRQPIIDTLGMLLGGLMYMTGLGF